MDRNAIIGFVLIGLILMIWMWMSAPPPPPPSRSLSPTGDTSALPSRANVDTSVSARPERNREAADTLGKFFNRLTGRTERKFFIDAGLYRATISSKGASIS